MITRADLARDRRRGAAGVLAALLALAVLVSSCTSKPQRRASTSATTASAAGEVSPTTAGAAGATGDWVTYNGPLTGDRYSPLSQITPANVSRLREKCAFNMPDSTSFESGIVAVDGVVYVTAFGNTYAFDGATCQRKWSHSRPEPATFLNVNRGVGYGDGKVFRGTGDAHVLALDARTGRLVWDDTIGNAKNGESVPMAPIEWNGLVFVGNAGGDNFDVQGRVYALDASNGHVVWRFNIIPDSAPIRATWHRASAANPPTGGATWTSYALDTASGTLYVTTGNSGPDFVEALHPGENLYTESLLALDAKSGRLLAHVQPYQTDFHDWDLSAGPASITTPGARPMILAASKNGYVYGVDRSGARSVAGRANDSPTTKTLDVRYKALVATRENADAPLSSEHMTRFCPGSQGGSEWNGPTYDHQLGTFYVNSIDWCTSVQLKPLDSLKGAPGQAWTGMANPKLAFGKQDPPGQWRGWVTAVNADNGQIRWKVRTPKPMLAGITSTAGGLVFTGDLDGNVLALDARTGKELWRNATGKAIGGGVISYEAGGKQYVAAATGLNSPIWPVHGGTARVVVYAVQ